MARIAILIMKVHITLLQTKLFAMMNEFYRKAMY